MRKSIIWLSLACGILLLPACKKEESTVSTPSLTGLSVSKAVPYVLAGETLVIHANTDYISASDRSDPGVLGLYWQVNSAKRDTLSPRLPEDYMDFVYTADTLGTYTVSCYAYAKSGYYNASASTTFSAIDPDTALTGLEGTADTPAGSILVRTATIGGAVWMAQNLYGTDTGMDYRNADAVTSVFGRYYTWKEAVTACPAGWHLPSAAEWDALGTDAWALMAPVLFLEKEMWEIAQGQAITNSLKFNAIPTGYIDKTASEQEHGLGQYAAFWTADAADQSTAHCRYLRFDQGKVIPFQGDKETLAMSVRCVKD